VYRLFRSLHSAFIDKDVLLIVGNNDEARDACLSTIRNLVLPRGCLKTRVVHDGHAIAVLKESIDAWVQQRKAELEQQEVFSIVNQDNR
jgi:intracellular sulfur oxidation DsrE/DsrF family protein